MKSEVLVYNKTKVSISKKLVSETILKLLDFLKIKQPIELAVLFVGDAEIRKLNKLWRRKDKVTNILSFPQLTKSELEKLTIFGSGSRKSEKFDFQIKTVLRLGEIVIDPHEISRSSGGSRKNFNFELTKIIIHGLLHLLGYNHESSKKEARLMTKTETQLLKLIS